MDGGLQSGLHTAVALVVLAAGAVLIAASGLSALRACALPAERASRVETLLVRCAVRALRFLGLRLRRHTLAQRAAVLAGPLVLIGLLLCWVAPTAFGGALIAESAAGAHLPFGTLTEAVLGGPVVGGLPGAVVALTRFAALVLLVLWAGKVARVVEAKRCRDRLTEQVGGMACSEVDAEQVIALYGRTRAGERLAALIDVWDAGLTEIAATHTAHPVLLLPTPPRCPNWITVLVIMLDVAAILDVATPQAAPPRTRAFLRSGCQVAQALPALLGVEAASDAPSLQGREERTFTTTLSIVESSGWPVRGDPADVYEAFQRWRRAYGPQTTALATHLMCDIPARNESHYPDVLPTAPRSRVG